MMIFFSAASKKRTRLSVMSLPWARSEVLSSSRLG
jgi:hypothetical protein